MLNERISRSRSYIDLDRKARAPKLGGSDGEKVTNEPPIRLETCRQVLVNKISRICCRLSLLTDQATFKLPFPSFCAQRTPGAGTAIPCGWLIWLPVLG